MTNGANLTQSDVADAVTWTQSGSKDPMESVKKEMMGAIGPERDDEVRSEREEETVRGARRKSVERCRHPSTTGRGLNKRVGIEAGSQWTTERTAACGSNEEMALRGRNRRGQ